ncbi:MAG: alpha/beta fold hydrolase [Pseudorhodoplanes sp.]
MTSSEWRTVTAPLRDERGGQSSGTTRVFRQGAGTPVVLIHGVGMNASFWAPQLPHLSGYDVVAYDMWGHGQASLPPPDARLSDYAAQLLGVMDSCGIAQAHIVGHSMGALISLEFALAHPERALSVTPMNAVYRRTPEQRAAVLKRVDDLKAQKQADDSVTLSRWFGDPIPPEWTQRAEEARKLLQEVNRVGYERTYRVFATSDEAHAGRLAQLAVPAFFVTAEFDPNSTPAMTRQMAAEVPGSRCEIIPGHRHMVTFTAAKDVSDRLIRFFNEVDKARRPEIRRAASH